jgi:general nucleoside transport system permease protein
MKHKVAYAVAAPLLAIVVSVAVSALALLAIGSSPVTAFKAMFSAIDSADAVVNILNRAAPYYVMGLAVALGFKMGLFNIGADGQYRIGALLAAAAGAAVSLPAPLHVLFVVAVAMIGAGAYAGVAGVLKVTRGVNEVVSTIMLNFIATGITAYLLSVYLRNKDVQLQSETEPLDKSAWLPPLNRAVSWIGYHLPSGVTLQGFLPVAVLTGIAFYLVVYRTRFGFDLRSTGANPRAALSSGVSPNAMIMKTICLSGAIAGLAGIGPLLAELHKYGDTFPTALGFTGIAVALLGRNHPAGIAVAAVVWAGIEQAARALPDVGIPQEIGRILQGTLLLSAVIAFEVVRRYGQAAAVRDAAARADALERRRQLGAVTA